MTDQTELRETFRSPAAGGLTSADTFDTRFRIVPSMERTENAIAKARVS